MFWIVDTIWKTVPCGPTGSGKNPIAVLSKLVPSIMHLWPGAYWTAWHLPDEPVGPSARWATTSHVEVGQATYPVNRGKAGMEGEKGARDSHRKRRGKEEVEQGRAGGGAVLRD